MTKQLSFDPTCSALLSMDYQSAIVSIYAGNRQEELLSCAASVLARARSYGMTGSRASDGDASGPGPNERMSDTGSTRIHEGMR